MARKSKTEKLNDIDIKIKELEELRKSMLDDMKKSIGEALINNWNVSDEKIITATIKHLTEQAKDFIENYDEEKEENLSSDNNNLNENNQNSVTTTY